MTNTDTNLKNRYDKYKYKFSKADMTNTDTNLKNRYDKYRYKYKKQI